MKLIIILIFLSSCSFLFPDSDAPKTAKGSGYEISFREHGWKEKEDKRSDFVFENSRDGRILLSNSFCNEFQEQALDRLASKTFNSIGAFDPGVSKYTTYRGREAFLMKGAGVVDGVEVTLQLLNTRRDNCYYDFIAISPAGTSDKESFFDQFLNSVVFK